MKIGLKKTDIETAKKASFSGFCLLLTAFWPVLAYAQTLGTNDGSLTLTNCLITPSQSVAMSAGRPGVLGQVFVERGDIIPANTLLAELDNGIEKSEEAIAKMRAESTTKIELAKARYNFEKGRAARAEDLVKDEHIPESDYQEAITARDLARLELAAARADRELAKLEQRRAEAMLAATRLIAPFNGIVVERHLSAGEYADRLPIITMASLDPLYVEVVVDAAHYGKIKKGDQAQITHELSGTQSLNAAVSVVDQSIDAASGTFRLRLELPNPDLAIPSGTSCSAAVLPGSAPQEDTFAASNLEETVLATEETPIETPAETPADAPTEQEAAPETSSAP